MCFHKLLSFFENHNFLNFRYKHFHDHSPCCSLQFGRSPWLRVWSCHDCLRINTYQQMIWDNLFVYRIVHNCLLLLFRLVFILCSYHQTCTLFKLLHNKWVWILFIGFLKVYFQWAYLGHFYQREYCEAEKK